jgi:hypothetical protein
MKLFSSYYKLALIIKVLCNCSKMISCSRYKCNFPLKKKIKKNKKKIFREMLKMQKHPTILLQTPNNINIFIIILI